MLKIFPVQMEFHVSRQARNRYQFHESLFSLSGNVIFANFHAARVFAQKMNSRRDLIVSPESAIRAGQINAMGLIDEIMHLVVQEYQEQRNPMAMQKALDWLDHQFGINIVDATLRRFCEEFPPLRVYRREITVQEYLDDVSVSKGDQLISNRAIVLEEMLMLWLANMNPAFSTFQELFDDKGLRNDSKYEPMITSLYQFFETQPYYGPDNQNLINLLRSPALKHPNSLFDQLEYIRRWWGYLLGGFVYRLLSSLDLIKEETKAVFGVGGGGPSQVYEFRGLEKETERFSPDLDWMPNLVLIAKNAYVWLDQLSKKYQSNIERLDQIPDAELDVLAQWGFTGLWLIGLWERSNASKRIKQMRGNPEAEASAYSIFNYDIASDLGGDAAYANLKERAAQRGIRLASDMVPNHMGIDSPWVIEHPDWFISLDNSPFPVYTFNGQNFSWDSRVGIYIEDHYFNNTDAAVVFKRVDFWTGSEKYIYHGNDGTSMPWNDTAQLNYLNANVREAVIQTILHVARKFSIIRFDAAMTLAKRHYQRLWFPEPGSGGDIPSRAEFGLTKAEFDRYLPEEFWRQVVDRVAQEAPDTLLLAEAFWLMEGYFVRTLGMHRVYNSAFMNMLRDERNQEYRLVIKNTIEFEPEILKRYVNFMNNPDERTAVDQFGKGDKYFGICTLMATMPGLPMFGHGQIEGFTEKYGMEYRRSYWNEQSDTYLVQRHEREIFPLLHRRHLFAGVSNFLLYDFFTVEGSVNEDVFAYTNNVGEEHALVVFHNKYADTRGWIRISSAYPVKTGQGEGGDRVLVRKNLGEGLGLSPDSNVYTIFRDQVTGLQFIRNSQELFNNGLYIELGAYKYHVFLDFQQVVDGDKVQLARLAEYLDGRGVPSIDEAMQEIFLQPLHWAFQELINADSFRWLASQAWTENWVIKPDQVLAIREIETKTKDLQREIMNFTRATTEADETATIRKEIFVCWSLPILKFIINDAKDGKLEEVSLFLNKNALEDLSLDRENMHTWGILLSWLFIHHLGEQAPAQTLSDENAIERSRTLIDEWQLGKIVAQAFQSLGIDPDFAWQSVGLIKILTSNQSWFRRNYQTKENILLFLRSLFQDVDVQQFISVNRYQNSLWFNKEAYERLMWWLYVIGIVQLLSDGVIINPTEDGLGFEIESDMSRYSQKIIDCYLVISEALHAGENSGYQVDRLVGDMGVFNSEE